MDGVIRDVRYALRGLRRSPGFLATAVLTLGLGIGATATMYSVVHDVLLAPLAYPEPDRLVGIGLTYPEEKPNAGETGNSADFVREHARSFESVGLDEDASTGANLAIGAGRALRVASTKVSQGFFPTLGVKPVLGRTFTAEEDVPGGPKVVMLSASVWKGTFNADAGVVNRVIRINEEPYTVVGVMPDGMFGSPETQGGAATGGIWLPMQMSQKDPGYDGTNYAMVGRLKRGVTLAAARQEVLTLGAPFFAAHPIYARWNRRKMHQFLLQPLQTVIVSEVRESLLVLLAAVVAVLLVACLNLAGLMTARAATRQREMAVRTALGATRFGLLRLLVSESLVLAVAGSALGLGLAQLARPLLLANSPIAIPTPMTQGGGAWSLIGFVVGVAFLTTMVCGLVPAWTVFRQDAQSGMKGGQAAGASASQVRLGKGLMVGQVAVAMVLLSAASLLLGSFLKIARTPTGLEVKRLVVAQVSLKGSAYEKTVATDQFVKKVLGELEHQPGVQRVAAVNGLPLDRGLNEGGYPAGRPEMQDTVETRTVTPGYFATLGIPVLAGRDLAESDRADSPKVVLVNEKSAEKWWPGRSPIGERVVIGGKDEGERTVVGVVADTRNHSLVAPDNVMIFAPMAQMSDGATKMLNGWFPTTFAIRMAGDVDVAGMVQSAVSEADPEIPVAKLTTMQEIVDNTVAAPKFLSWMAAGFAGFALLLTVIGLFGLLSYQVTQRTREIGVRMAVGARRGEILGLILGRGVTLTAVGLAVGGAVSLAVPRVVGSLLVDNVAGSGEARAGLMSSPVMALGSAALAMLLAAGLASLLPARRAARVEPVEALRSE